MLARRPGARPVVWRALVAATLVVVAAGCTSSRWDTSEIDAPTTTAKPYTRDEAGLTASLTDYLSKVGDDLNEWAPSADQAECAAQRVVRRLTVDHLLDIGFDPQDATLALAYPADERTAVVNILAGCIDVTDGVLEMFSSYQKLPLAQSDCMAKGFDRLGLGRDLITAIVDGKEPDPFANSDRYASGLAALAVECLGEEDLLPNAPMPAMPEPEGGTTTTTTTTPSLGPDDDGLVGIEPGGPLDTTTSTTPVTTTPK